MPVIVCIDCGESFSFSEVNHKSHPKPERCPECREDFKIEQELEKYRE